MTNLRQLKCGSGDARKKDLVGHENKSVNFGGDKRR